MTTESFPVYSTDKALSVMKSASFIVASLPCTRPKTNIVPSDDVTGSQL